MKYQDGQFNDTCTSVIGRVVTDTAGTSWLSIFFNGFLFSAPMWLEALLFPDIRWLEPYAIWIVILGPEILILIALSMISDVGWGSPGSIADVFFSAIMYGGVLMVFSAMALFNCDGMWLAYGLLAQVIYTNILYIVLTYNRVSSG